MEVFICMNVLDVDGEEIEIIFQRSDIKFIAKYEGEIWVTIQVSPDKQIRYQAINTWDEIIETLKRTN